MGCFYCDEHHEGREAIMYKVGEMEAGVLYLFKDQAHKGRCALALKNHRKELCECGPEELAAFARDLARASGAVKELWGCDKINLGSFGDTNPHLHFHIVPKYEGGFVMAKEPPNSNPRIRVRRLLRHHESGAGAALRGRIPGDDRRPAGKAGDVSLPAPAGLLAESSCLLNTFPLFCAAAL